MSTSAAGSEKSLTNSGLYALGVISYVCVDANMSLLCITWYR